MLNNSTMFGGGLVVIFVSSKKIYLMKKKALELLATKFEGVSETILGRIADKILKTAETEDDLSAAVDKVTVQSLLESYADSRVTEAQRTAVENYKKKHGIVDDPKQPSEPTKQDPAPAPKKDDEMPAWAKSLVEANEKLTNELAAIKGEKTKVTREAALSKALKGVPEAFKSRYTKDFSRLTFKDDEDFDSWISEITTEAADIAKNYGTSRFSAPKSQAKPTANEDINPFLKARIEDAKAETHSSAIIGMPK